MKVPTIMTVVEQMKEESARRSIMVLRRPLKNDAKKCIPVIEKTKYRMEVFLVKDHLNTFCIYIFSSEYFVNCEHL